MKSRVKGDFQARFRENVGVKFPCVTRLPAMLGPHRTTRFDRLTTDICRTNGES